MKSIILKALGAFAFLSLSNSAFAQEMKSHTYLTKIPASAISCQDEASKLASRFESASGFSVTKAECRGVVELSNESSVYPYYSLLISYTAKNPVEVYSAQFGQAYIGSTPQSSEGIFDNIQSCVTNMKLQTKNFEDSTGLKALTTTCVPGDYSGTKSFVLKIDGVGQPKKRLYVFSPRLNEETAAAFNQDVDSLFAKSNTAVAFKATASWYYYSEYSSNLNYRRLGRFKDAAQCSGQLNEVSKLYASRGSLSSVKCVRESEAKKADVLLEVVADKMGLTDLYQSGKYYTYSECLQDKARVLSERSNQGYSTLTALCFPDLYDSNLFEMKLYSFN